MAVKETRGVVSEQTIREDSVVRDSRRMTHKFADWIKVPANMAVFLLSVAGVAFVFPAIEDICLLVAAGFTFWGMRQQEILPLKLPITSKMLDPHERSPKDGAASPASGIFFLGNEMKSGREVWLTNSDMRQHFLVLGTTGAGKTEALLGFASNAVTWGSGFLFCDGKADVSLFAKIYALARRFGREDDLLVLNFMTGNQDIGGSDGKLLSNTLNPFAFGSSDSLTQMIVSLMDEGGSEGGMWKGRATAMLTGVLRALTWLRDQQIIDLNVSEIRDHLNLKRIIELGDPAKFPDMPQHIRKSIKSYLTSLPGYKETQPADKQSNTTLDQHGYLEMQFTKILGSLADVYGHIFKTPYGEIDMTDVVLNRRILVVMLPALEKASDEIANLGKIVVATLKGMMGSTLGSKIEGDWFGVVEQRPTTAPTPFIVILDEVGYYMVDGMDLMSAQARSLGFCLVFAGQDLHAMKRFNDKVFGSVQGNTNTKIIMRTEDPETAKLAVDSGGKAMRAQLASFQGETGQISTNYRDNMEARVESVERINPLDLKSQDEGEMHILHKEWLVRAKTFYSAPQDSLNKNGLILRPNHFITVVKPDAEEIESHRRIPELFQRFLDKDFASQMKTDAANALANMSGTDEASALARVMLEIEKSKRRTNNPVEASVAAFAKVLMDSKSISDAYAKEVHDVISNRRRISAPFDDEDDALSIRRQRMPEADPFGAFDDEGSLEEQMFNSARTKSEPSRPPVTRMTRKNRFRKDVNHGVQIEGHEMFDMADRISSNDSVMRTLAALDFDAETQTREEIDVAIEEAIGGDALPRNKEKQPFDRSAVKRADDATLAMMPEFEDDEDGDIGGDVTTNFLGALIDDDEDEDQGDGK